MQDFTLFFHYFIFSLIKIIFTITQEDPLLSPVEVFHLQRKKVPIKNIGPR